LADVAKAAIAHIIDMQIEFDDTALAPATDHGIVVLESDGRRRSRKTTLLKPLFAYLGTLTGH
jgi:hypothetical protein